MQWPSLLTNINASTSNDQTVTIDENTPIVWEGQTLEVHTSQSPVRAVNISEVTVKSEVENQTAKAPSKKMQESVELVKTHFNRGCKCLDSNCFRYWKPENVHQHRMKIAKLKKEERDMYLMGLIISSTVDFDDMKQKSKYVYQGKPVCLDAFSYLHNCSLYLLRHIKRHVEKYGVTRRIPQGNIRKKAKRSFYEDAKEFVKEYFNHCDLSDTDTNLKKVYREYKNVVKTGIKVMDYATFCRIVEEQLRSSSDSDLEKTDPDQVHCNAVEGGVVKCMSLNKLPTYQLIENDVEMNGEETLLTLNGENLVLPCVLNLDV